MSMILVVQVEKGKTKRKEIHTQGSHLVQYCLLGKEGRLPKKEVDMLIFNPHLPKKQIVESFWYNVRKVQYVQ